MKSSFPKRKRVQLDAMSVRYRRTVIDLLAKKSFKYKNKIWFFFFLKIKLHETNAFVIKKKVKEAIKTVRILIFSHGGSATERNY